MGMINNPHNASMMKQDNNIQGILDLVVTNDDLMNKFYDIIFNFDNQALKLPSVSRDDNKSIQQKLKGVDIQIGKRKFAVLTSDAMNESVKKPNIMNFAGGMGKKSHGGKYDGHNLEKAVDNKMKVTSQSKRLRLRFFMNELG